MEIGGCDMIYVTDHPHQLFARIMSFLDWKDAVAEYPYQDQVFYYENQAVKDMWDTDPDAEIDIDTLGQFLNTMIYFVFDDKELAVITDPELTERIREAFPEFEKMGLSSNG